jgi:hypothetical protein
MMPGNPRVAESWTAWSAPANMGGNRRDEGRRSARARELWTADA